MSYTVTRGTLATEQLNQMGSGGVSLKKLCSTVEKAEKDIIAHPDLAELPRHQLKGNLKGTLRFKVGRFRVFYIVSKDNEAARILYVGYRKDGDKKDAYTQFEKLLKAGKLDVEYEALGLTPPKP